MRKTLTTLAALASVVISTTAWAAPATPEAVEKLLQVSRLEGIMEQIYGQFDQTLASMMTAMAKDQPLTDEQRRSLDAMVPKLSAVMREELNWAKLKPLYVQVYAESLTMEEVEGLAAFYATPVGQSTLQKLPMVMQKTMAQMSQLMPPMMAKVQAIAKQAVEDAKAGKR